MITGAARGIGRSTALAFAREGADVMGIDVAGVVTATLGVVPSSAGEPDETGRLVSADGGRWASAELDRRNPPALRTEGDRAVAELGRLDILFADAGIQSFKPLLEMEDADRHDQIDVNLNGTADAPRAVAPHLVRDGGGRVIVTSPAQGRPGTECGGARSASKWSIPGLMTSALLELGARGITVDAVTPGLNDTPLTRHRQRCAQAVDDLEVPGSTAAPEHEAIEGTVAEAPPGVPWIEPEAIAPMVVFLASDDARMASGAACDVTGGDSAHDAA